VTGINNYLLRMVVFLAVVSAGAFVLYPQLSDAFLANPLLNGIIIAVLALGIVYTFWQVLMIRPEVSWLETYQRDRGRASEMAEPAMIGPLAQMLGDHRGRLRLSAPAMRSLLDSIGTRLDERREISRYIMRLLVFLGLLGTFWGLIQTIGAVLVVIDNLTVQATSDITSVFEEFKGGLIDALSGAGTAFSTSLFGLAGSLVVGFLDLQAGQAQNRFYTDLEDWLSGTVRLTGAGAGAEEAGVPAYVQALLEQTAESLDELQKAVTAGQEDRRNELHSIMSLTEKLGVLTDQMRTEQQILSQLAESQSDLKPALERLSERSTGAIDDATRDHIRKMDFYLGRLVEDSAAGRAQLIEAMRGEFKLLARTIAAASDGRE